MHLRFVAVTSMTGTAVSSERLDVWNICTASTCEVETICVLCISSSNTENIWLHIYNKFVCIAKSVQHSTPSASVKKVKVPSRTTKVHEAAKNHKGVLWLAPCPVIFDSLLSRDSQPQLGGLEAH